MDHLFEGVLVIQRVSGCRGGVPAVDLRQKSVCVGAWDVKSRAIGSPLFLVVSNLSCTSGKLSAANPRADLFSINQIGFGGNSKLRR